MSSICVSMIDMVEHIDLGLSSASCLVGRIDG